MRALFGFLIALLCATAPALAQEPAAPPSEKIVGVRLIEPFVMKNGDVYSGFSIDLWRAIANELNWSARFVPHENVSTLIEAVQNRKVDLASRPFPSLRRVRRRSISPSRCSTAACRS